jgi:hypothetical protein
VTEQVEHETGESAGQRAEESGGALSPAERADLLARYRRLVLTELPRRGAAERWVVRADHCFGRIVLDHAVGACWYDVLYRRRGPAFAQLDDDQLRRAVAVAEQIDTGGDPVLRRLNDQSLAWRGHPPARPGRPTRSS